MCSEVLRSAGVLSWDPDVGTPSPVLGEMQRRSESRGCKGPTGLVWWSMLHPGIDLPERNAAVIVCGGASCETSNRFDCEAGECFAVRLSESLALAARGPGGISHHASR